jgi:DNA polymerase elongation subunit (family B)
MGIVLKRRDNAPIVKLVFGGAIDIIMNEHDIKKAFEFVKSECSRVLKGEFELDKFIISKTLKSYYKKPRQIAHNVLACRQAQRDPGNRFEPNDRVPYAFIVNNSSKKLLQGDKIETPDFIRQNKQTLDYKTYITNQIMKPVAQIFELVPGLENMEEMLTLMLDIYENERTGNISLDKFVKKRTTPDIKTLFERIEEAKRERKSQSIVCEDNDSDDSDDDAFDSDENDGDGEVEGTSNYDDPNF